MGKYGSRQGWEDPSWQGRKHWSWVFGWYEAEAWECEIVEW